MGILGFLPGYKLRYLKLCLNFKLTISFSILATKLELFDNLFSVSDKDASKVDVLLRYSSKSVRLSLNSEFSCCFRFSRLFFKFFKFFVFKHPHF
jgi:hypothetical protein